MSHKKINIVVAGATGYVGLDLVFFLSKHPKVNISYLCAQKKIGNNIFYFNLMDYIKPTNQGDLSAKNYFEVNCLDLSYRYIKDFYYKEPMGNGEYTIFDEIGEWEITTQGSIGDKVRKFVCNYK